MLRTLLARGLQAHSEVSHFGEEMHGRIQIANQQLSNRLLDETSPLRFLLRGPASEEQGKDTLELYSLASEFAILCGLSEKEMQIRMWDELPLFGKSQARMMELSSASKAAQKDNLKDVDRTLETRPVVLMLRPCFSYLVEPMFIGPETNEHVVSRSKVVVAKREAPVAVDPEARYKKEQAIFSNFGPGIAEELENCFPCLSALYNSDGEPERSFVTPLGHTTDLLSDKGIWRQLD